MNAYSRATTVEDQLTTFKNCLGQRQWDREALYLPESALFNWRDCSSSILGKIDAVAINICPSQTDCYANGGAPRCLPNRHAMGRKKVLWLM